MSVCDQRYQRLDACDIERRLSPDSRSEGEPTEKARACPTLERDLRWLEVLERFGFSIGELAEFLSRPIGTIRDGLRRARTAREAESLGLSPRQLSEVRAMYGSMDDKDVKAFLKDPTPGWRERNEAKTHAGT